jgi:hypothetical protein
MFSAPVHVYQSMRSDWPETPQRVSGLFIDGVTPSSAGQSATECKQSDANRIYNPCKVLWGLESTASG